MSFLRASVCGMLLCGTLCGQQPDPDWYRIKLDERFRSEGVAAADINRDGRMDVVAGDVWYAAPEVGSEAWRSGRWKQGTIRTPGEFVAGKGYSRSFVNVARDLNGDGWTDVIIVGFPGAPFHWYENPKDDDELWKEHRIAESICNESPEFEDLDGDGRPEMIFGMQPAAKMGFTRLPRPAAASKPWSFTAISEKGDPARNGTFKYYHGLGIGDVNNDGRRDVMIPHGWWEAPADGNSEAPWRFHADRLVNPGAKNPPASANMYTEDLDLDGDNDIIMSSAHQYGVWWFENVGGNDDPDFRGHLIDKSFSQSHAMEFVDLNGDGQRDIVTGKRFLAHNGGDPGAKEPVVVCWYEITRKKGQRPQFVRHEITAGRGTGIGTQFQICDVNNDKRPDIVLSNKSGVNLLVQKSTTTRGQAPLPRAKPADVEMSGEVLQRVRTVLQKKVDANRIPGAVIAVARKGRLVMFDAVGWRDVERKQPMQTDSVLRFYSMTKAVTSVAAMMLVEEGKLELDAPVSKYLPELKAVRVYKSDAETEACRREMTVRDLLRHTAGFTYGIFGSSPVDRQYMFSGVMNPRQSLDRMSKKLARLPLLYQPGTRWEYSVSSDVLGRVIEVASGQDFDVFLTQRILRPLGMKDTGFFVEEANRGRFASNYSHGPDGLSLLEASTSSSFLRDPKLKSGGGGLVSTAGDYIRFCQMLLNGGTLGKTRLLKQGTVAEMTKNQLPAGVHVQFGGNAREGVGFGLGFNVITKPTRDMPGARTGEYGWGGMASTHYWISPADELAVVLLTQRTPFTFELEFSVKGLIYSAIDK